MILRCCKLQLQIIIKGSDKKKEVEKEVENEVEKENFTDVDFDDI